MPFQDCSSCYSARFSLIAFSLKGSSGGHKSPHSVSTEGDCTCRQVGGKFFHVFCQIQGRTTVFTFDQDSRPTDDAIACDSVADIQQSRHLQCRNYDHC